MCAFVSFDTSEVCSYELHFMHCTMHNFARMHSLRGLRGFVTVRVCCNSHNQNALTSREKMNENKRGKGEEIFTTIQ